MLFVTVQWRLRDRMLYLLSRKQAPIFGRITTSNAQRRLKILVAFLVIYINKWVGSDVSALFFSVEPAHVLVYSAPTYVSFDL